MKSTRFVKVLAVILVITMLPLWAIGCGSKLCDTAFNTLANELLGDVKLDTKDAATKTYLTALDADVKYLMDYYKEGGWPSRVITDGESIKTFHYKSIYKLAVAYNTKGSAYSGDKTILEAAKAALQYGYNVHFGVSQMGSNTKDFTLSDRAICAEYLIKSVMLLQSKLKKAEIEQWFSILDLKFPAPVGTGLDKLRTTYVCIAYYAYLGNAENVKKFAANFIDDVLTLVDSGDGLYADGTYIWNINTVSTLDYGVEAVNLLTDLYVALKGTECELPDATVQALYNWVISMKHSLYNGSAMNSSLGMSITQSDEMGGRAIEAMLKVAQICNEEQAVAIKSIVKAYGNQKDDDTKGDGKFAIGLGSYGAALYAKVVKDSKIEAASTNLGAYTYAAADTLSVLGAKFGLSLSMTSIRTNKYYTSEIPYQEPNAKSTAYNGTLWFARDGMFTLYTENYKLPSNYWSYINTYRLPGTTVDNRARQNLDVIAYNGITNYAGAAVIGNTAVAAMIVTGNNSEYLSDLTGKKAWFVFDDKIVCLGTDISNSTTPKQVPNSHSQNIETIIENIYYNKYNAAYTSVKDDYILSNAEKIIVGSGETDYNAMFFTGYGGVYIPASNLDVVKTKLNATDGGNYVEIWMEHGAAPDNASYEYAIYPATAVNMRKFFEMIDANKEAGKADYTVLANTSDVQAVKDDNTGAAGYTFWNAAECNGIAADFACTVMVKETDKQITIAIADFSHYSPDNREGGTITLSGNYTLVSADTGLTIEGNTITVDRTVAANGQTLTIVLSK